ncbi:TBC1 domain family member 31-like isoform X2 [Watersipora subatra]|uniref:TBC1 domain family member 31-like isoform X2 n=1 Tax=Watersipora subatra TaxID=2589382 RepID=UPI00355C8A06
MQLFVRKKRSGNVFVKKPDIGDDGLIVEVVNSIKATSSYVGQCRQKSEVIFVQVAISSSGDLVIAGDIHGNIFAINIMKNRFHLVKHLSVPCTRMSASLKRKSDILVASSDYSLRCYNVDTESQLACLRGHDSAIVSLSIHPSKRYALSTSSDNATLWNLDTFDRKRKLTITKGIALLAAQFIPSSNSILTCFKDNSMLVWDAESMELKHELKSTQSYDVSYRTFACNSDGSVVACAGKSNVIHLWDFGSERIKKILQLQLEIKQVKQLEFLPKHLYREETLVAICSDGVLRFIDISESKEIWTIGSYEHKVVQASLAESGCNLACIMDSGNLNIYDIEVILKRVETDRHADNKKDSVDVERDPRAKVIKVQHKTANKLKDMIRERVESSQALSHVKLREILKEYGEFPEKYRTFIWKTILRLPENYEAYSALLDKGIHPAYVNIHKVYPIRSSKLLRVFQRLLSALAYWTPAAVECTFLPSLAFPFAKLLQNNQLIAFEVVASVLLNCCQRWFDYTPNPPLNILSLIENLLSYHDRELFQHFIRYRVTTQTYAWTLLLTGFSEVFSRSEWMKLWDHILINEPSWLLLAVVAYSLVNRRTLLDCYDTEAFKQFYRHHNATGVSHVIKETYNISRTTPTELDPSSCLHAFHPLNKGQYQLLAKFPQRVKNFPQNELERIRKEQLSSLKSDVAFAKR